MGGEANDHETLRQLPLARLHEAAGARFGPFAGWSMPLTYPAGVMKEHQHTRQAAGLFDISHMKLIEVEGPGAGDLLARACPFDPAALATGISKYTFLLADDAGILDDLIVTRLGPQRLLVVANAGNAASDEARLRELSAGFEVSVKPLDRVFLALQGPEAEDILRVAGIAAGDLVFMTGREPRDGWFVSRSGYTGEDGFEIALPAEEAEAFCERIIGDGRAMWIGLAARDSLRLEAGLCLHGQDITPETDPVSASLMWAIPKAVREAGRFEGARALAAIVEKGPARRRVGLRPLGRQPVRAGATLADADGRTVGTVTSGGFGPSVGHPVAMGYVDAAVARAPVPLVAKVRGTDLAVEIASLPFTPHRYRKG